MIFGYARTSTTEQEAGLEAQLRDLRAAGCERIYDEKVSSVGARPQLDKVLAMIRPGDIVVVTKLDRLARSVSNMWQIIKHIENEGAAIRILNLGIDATTPTGKLMLNVMAGVAQFEREMMLERQREGIAKARRDGKYTGRKPLSSEIVTAVRAMHNDKRRPTDIARQLGIGRTSVYRALQR